MKATHVRMIIVLVLMLGSLGRAQGDELYVGPGETYATIQDAVDAAVSGDIIHVAAGTYVEQVFIDGKDLAVIGAGQGLTTVEAPASLVVAYATGSGDHYPVIWAQAAVIQLSALTVDGAGMGNDHDQFMGVDYHNAGGSVVDVEIVRVRNEPFDGAQHGVSLYLYNEDATARTFTVQDCLIHDYQKNAMALFAAAGTPLDLTVTGNETVGNGPTDVTAQNGIQIQGPDITATISGNLVRDVAWDGATWTATGLILYDCAGSLTGNTLSGCQTGAWLTLAPMTITGNELTVPRVAEFGIGLVADNYVGGFKLNRRAKHAPQPLQEAPRQPRAAKATIAYTITGNTFALDPAVVDNLDCVGLWLLNEQGVDDLQYVATGNAFTGFDLAAYVNEAAPTDGAILAADLDQSSFAACTGGILNDASLVVDAEDSWWGDAAGPGGEGPGQGATVSEDVDYDPWITDLTNLLCVPDPLALDAATPAGTVVFDYTGGASGRIYGYSIDVVWDPAVATALAEDFVRPASGDFAAATAFIVQDIAAGHVRVDAALGGEVPGIFAGPLFQALFAAATGAPGGAETALTITVNEIRDMDNATLTGLIPDPGLIVVDLDAPAILEVLVTDTTLPSVDWTRDGHDIQVDATVVEDDIATLTCDLTAFGGPVLGLGDAAVDGNVYTWTFGPLADTGDGAVAAEVVCFDGLGQSATLSDEITADNTPPLPLVGLQVLPGHEQIHLAWTEPAADGGSPLAGVVFRYAAWGGYPHYTGALPDAPADITQGEPVGDPVSGALWDWAIAPRDVYVLAGFVVDLVGNAGPLGETGAATNYWLGDTDGDGYLTVDPDVNALGESYGKTFGQEGYDGDCDVGPTFDYSPRGIPDPQSDGFQVQFEDLMVFALNYGEVDPARKFDDGEVPTLRWERLDEITWVLALLEDCTGLKGVQVTAELPAGVTCQVAGGALLGQQDAPVFLRNIAANGLDAGVATIGFGEAITGHGELLRVTTSAPVADLAAKVAARDLGNRELLVELPEVTGAPVPQAHALAQNFPNPFNPATTIAFALPRNERTRLAIYTVEGRLVRTLLDEELAAGRHEIVWQGRDDAGRQVATGTYFYALRAGDFRQVRKMILVK